ncbi:hypothetical protein TWF718_002796 [Orbilia javanica]|uniref:Killer toxin Kp4 domain-containing protein n=1 Tax=Orbilia javanica TaxID=47235 RepID=A0AAN8MF00_9PEZI
MDLLPFLFFLSLGFGKPLPQEPGTNPVAVLNPTTDISTGFVTSTRTSVGYIDLHPDIEEIGAAATKGMLTGPSGATKTPEPASVSTIGQSVPSLPTDYVPLDSSPIGSYPEESAASTEHTIPTPYTSSVESPTIRIPYQTEDTPYTSLVASSAPVVDPATDSPGSVPPPLSPQGDFSSPFHDASGKPLRPGTQTPPHVPRGNPVVDGLASLTTILFPAPKHQPGHDGCPVDVLHDNKTQEAILPHVSLPGHRLRPRKPLGINCRGKFNCAFGVSNYMSTTLSHLIDEIPDDRLYTEREKIACAFGIGDMIRPHKFLCAWLEFGSRSNTEYYENLGGGVMLSAWNVKRLAREIVKHGCKRCGSVPIEFPAHNDGSLGYLTFNTMKAGCPGDIADISSICHAGRAPQLHEALVGQEVSQTMNGTADTDGSSHT